MGKFIKIGGTANQFLKADGSIDEQGYMSNDPAESLYAGSVTINGYSLTYNFKLKKINGIVYALYGSGSCPSGCFANSNTASKSTSKIPDNCRPYGVVNCLIETQCGNKTNHDNSIYFDDLGYVYTHGSNTAGFSNSPYHALSSSTNFTFGCFWFVKPFEL
jgi:hypothetical protein